MKVVYRMRLLKENFSRMHPQHFLSGQKLRHRPAWCRRDPNGKVEENQNTVKKSRNARHI